MASPPARLPVRKRPGDGDAPPLAPRPLWPGHPLTGPEDVLVVQRLASESEAHRRRVGCVLPYTVPIQSSKWRGIHLGGCGRRNHQGEACDVDHIIPAAYFSKVAAQERALYERDWNCQPTHLGCNRLKAGRREEWPKFRLIGRTNALFLWIGMYRASAHRIDEVLGRCEGLTDVCCLRCRSDRGEFMFGFQGPRRRLALGVL